MKNFVYFKLLPKLSNFSNSDDSIGKTTSKSIRINPAFKRNLEILKKDFKSIKNRFFLVKKWEIQVIISMIMGFFLVNDMQTPVCMSFTRKNPIIIDIITWTSHIFTRKNLFFIDLKSFFNKNWIYSDNLREEASPFFGQNCNVLKRMKNQFSNFWWFYFLSY